ncbi:MAG: enoyl-CoA hydratase/isomerase family protein [Desulfobacteraceae bacterium]|nr:enoyl-CoA hydratase/isomerase family protein [Desulfobacteraceae bacterium]MBC2754766.1 enoyl-CoA hydratase/isomerase family protein [Desulfobacteraceae bacterium]
MSKKTVLITKTNKICTLTLNRPKVMNALNLDVSMELMVAFEQIASDDDIHVVILEGANGNFSTGADFSLFYENHSVAEWLEGMQFLSRLIRRIREIPQPIISKLRGAAYGGGSNLALAADFVIAAHNARFCENFIHIGTILDTGGTYFLPRLVGLVKAREIAFLGEEITGKTAASLGLIYKSVLDDELDSEVMTLAEKLTQKSLKALALIKQGLETSFDNSLKEVMDWEGAHQAIMLQSPEHKAIVKMFFDARAKRKKDKKNT